MVVGINDVFTVGDHDFSRTSLTPSVTLVITIPEKIDDSFYRGEWPTTCFVIHIFIHTYIMVCLKYCISQYRDNFIGVICQPYKVVFGIKRI